MAISPTTATTATTQSTTTASSNALAQNYETFLKLLTTQLKNQSPLDPVKPDEFTQQLVQFSSVEQQINSNKNLEQLISVTKTQQATALVGYVGKQVEATGTQQQLSNGAASWPLNVEKAATATLTVRNAAGQVVYEKNHTLASGQQTFHWDGRDNSAQKLADGLYTLSVEAQDKSGTPVRVTQGISGTVEAVDFAASEPMLVISGMRVPVSSVTVVRHP